MRLFVIWTALVICGYVGATTLDQMLERGCQERVQMVERDRFRLVQDISSLEALKKNIMIDQFYPQFAFSYAEFITLLPRYRQAISQRAVTLASEYERLRAELDGQKEQLPRDRVELIQRGLFLSFTQPLAAQIIEDLKTHLGINAYNQGSHIEFRIDPRTRVQIGTIQYESRGPLTISYLKQSIDRDYHFSIEYRNVPGSTAILGGPTSLSIDSIDELLSSLQVSNPSKFYTFFSFKHEETLKQSRESLRRMMDAARGCEQPTR